jgi:hypothetical protein
LRLISIASYSKMFRTIFAYRTDVNVLEEALPIVAKAYDMAIE